MSLAALLQQVTESDLFVRAQGYLQGKGVAVSQWLSEVNLGLALTHLLTEGQTVAHNAASELAAAAFLEHASGEGLTLFARSHFSLDRYPAIFAEHLFFFSAATTAPQHNLVAGEQIAGTPGSAPILLSNTENGTLTPGGKRLVRMRAQEAGAQGNLAAKSALRLRSALVGVDVSNPPALIVPGVDANGHVRYAQVSLAPVQVEHVAGGALGVLALGQLVRVTLAPTTTAVQVAAAVNADPLCAALVFAQAEGSGGSLAGALAQTTLTTSVVLAGQEEEEDGTLDPPRGLKGRCLTRWATTGAGGSEEAMVYWARALPVGYTASPVTKVRAWSNRYASMIAGAAGTILVAGPSGSLSPTDLAAVKGNFENPRKYALATLLSIETTTNLTVMIGGTVYVLRSANCSIAEVQTAVAAAMAAYAAQLDIGGQGGKVYRQKLGARIEDAAPTAIRNVDLSSPATDPIVGYAESVVFDPSALQYELVDG